MLFICASDLSTSDMALLGNNIRPIRRRSHVTPDERRNRRVLAGVNRSLSSLQERVDQLYPSPAKPARRALAS